jgi:photosystem II stability/assembly factor-like uncharacterized protein
MLQIFHHRVWTGVVLALAMIAAPPVQAQWRMQTSGTSVSLRGIHAVDANTAWASGADGTVLRTVDGGQHWDTCGVPPDAGKLDFRNVWAWDADHAMVMSSGPGMQSKLYSTHDGCRTWRSVFTNPDALGFWDALQFDGSRFGVILGDPVDNRFTVFATYDGGRQWTRQVDPCLRTETAGQGAFAASNQALVVQPMEEPNASRGFEANHRIWIGTSGGWVYGLQLTPLRLIADVGCVRMRALPSNEKNAAAGVFALAFRNGTEGVAVGGDYTKPHDGTETAALTTDGIHWQQAVHQPAGYRSSVAWNAADGSWIATGTSGSDESRDCGKNWQPLDHENWNALSLPFVVGPNGRIGRLISWGQLRAASRTLAVHPTLAANGAARMGHPMFNASEPEK